MRERLAVLDGVLLGGRKPPPRERAERPAPTTPRPERAQRPAPAARREPLRPLHRAGRAVTALWWFVADGALLTLAAVLRGLQHLRTPAVGAPVGCVVVGLGISLWWGSWAYAIIGALAAACFVWIARAEQSPRA